MQAALETAPVSSKKNSQYKAVKISRDPEPATKKKKDKKKKKATIGKMRPTATRQADQVVDMTASEVWDFVHSVEPTASAKAKATAKATATVKKAKAKAKANAPAMVPAESAVNAAQGAEAPALAPAEGAEASADHAKAIDEALTAVGRKGQPRKMDKKNIESALLACMMVGFICMCLR